ncbi:hypothetical protein MHK_005928 [Candidatus Magnetomorum sp. HK-1]|nr:hypothetical protein MHK_005928 [Candidatus Magnetomorum sp. HK-1]
MKKIDFTITHRFNEVSITEKEFKNLLSISCWNCIPYFPHRGRSAWHILEEPASVNSDLSYKLKAAKLKGVGLCEEPGNSEEQISAVKPLQPTTKPHDAFATYPHFGIAKDGQYESVYSEIAPLGGILHRRAILEFQSAKKLYENKVPTFIPLAVLRYKDDYQFQKEPMGAVITLSPDTSFHRLSTVQFGAAVCPGIDAEGENYYIRIQKALEVKGNPKSEEVRLQIINILSRKLGKLMHDFSKVGLYRHGSEWSNYNFDFERCEVLLTDLDSSLLMADLPEELRFLHAMRDLCSLLYRTLSKFYTPQSLGAYSLSNLIKFNPLLELLRGYFPETSEDKLLTISKKLWDCFAPHYFMLNNYRQSIRDIWSIERRKSYKMDHLLFYVLAMTLLFPIFKESDLLQVYPSNLTMKEQLKKAKAYLNGEQHEYFLYILNDKN